MLKRFNLWVAFVFLTTTVGTTASVSQANELVTELAMVQIEDLDLKGLKKLQGELDLHLESVRAIRQREVIMPPEGINALSIRMLGTIPVQESADALMRLIQVEIQRGEFIPNLVAGAVQMLGEIATKDPGKYVRFLRKSSEFLKQYPNVAKMAEHFEEVATQIEARENTLPKLSERIEWVAAQEKMGTPRQRLESIRKILDSQLLGQPEVAQALVDLEWRTSLYGLNERTRPDVVYLLGLPGTGKDTAAEAITNALHGRENAHEKHMFTMPLMKSKADTWIVLGSGTGFIGSDNFPPFLDFLVKHSDGKYKKVEVENPGGKKFIRIIENPDYKGKTLQGYFPPNKGVVFLNEFHNWSKQLKDDIVKQALEKGYFSINNPNGGLANLFVPIRFVIASNEGIGLLTAREANGQRHGKPLTFEELEAKWEKVHTNKAAIKNEILATNGSPNNRAEGESAPGISEELLNRIPERFVLMMRPLNPETLQKIVEQTLTKAVQKIQGSSELIKTVKISWSPELVRLIQSYDYIPEENARPVKDRIISFVEEPLIDAIRGDRLKDIRPGATLELGVQEGEDKTRSLTITIDDNGRRSEITQLIRTTLKDIPVQPISNERIDRLARVGDELKALVFGIDSIVERIAQRAVAIENEGASGQNRPASILMLNGLSSTGKTELAKQLARLLGKANGGTGAELKTFDFSQIQSLHDFKARILGLTDSRGNPIASDFMKHYDRNNGNIIVALDELANVRDADLLKSLYDFFREPVVSTFSDGKARPMGGVKIIITGNAGQEIYDRVPRHVPMSVQMAAWQEIYERANLDHDFQRTFLERSYPAPLLNRIGRNNIFFMPPHNYRSLRQLAQLKLGEAIERIKDTNSRRGWHIQFPSVQAYTKLIDTIIEEGFSLRYQGASIETFIRDDLEEPLKYRLLQAKVPSNARVTIQFNRATDNQIKENPGKVYFDLIVEGQSEPLTLEIRRPYVEKPVETSRTGQIVTAFHEAAHSIAREVLFEGAFAPIKISIIPGVALMGHEWVYYAGIAEHLQQKEVPVIREWFVRQIAVFAAGETAERFVTKGARDSTGKSNDMKRATSLAQDAIIRYGLSPKWGTHAIPDGVSTEAYVAGLSENQKTLLEAETQALVREGRALAEKTLALHFESHLVPLGNLLAEKGELNQEALKQFYSERKTLEPAKISRARAAILRAQTFYRWLTSRPSRPMALEILDSIPAPRSVANVDQIAQDRKAAQFSTVETPRSIPLVQESRMESTTVIPLRAPGSFNAILAATRVRVRCMEAHLAR